MIWVVISVNNSYIYGPFSSYKYAAVWRDDMEKKHFNQSYYVKRVINPANIDIKED